MPVVNINDLHYRPFTATDTDFTAGKDNDTSIPAGDVAEVGVAEVGDDGQLSNYDAVQIGQRPAATGGDNQGNEVFIDLAQGDGADAADTVEFAVAARRKGEVGGGVSGEVTGFRGTRGQDTADARQRTSLGPQSPVVRYGRVLQFLTRDEHAAHEVDITHAETTIEIPAMGGM